MILFPSKVDTELLAMRSAIEGLPADCPGVHGRDRATEVLTGPDVARHQRAIVDVTRHRGAFLFAPLRARPAPPPEEASDARA